MKILFVTADLPYPPTDGARTRNYNILKILETRHQVTLLSFIKPGEPVSASPLSDHCMEIRTVPQKVPRGGIDRTYGILSAFLKRKPYHVVAYHSHKMEKAISDLSTSGYYDVVHVDHLQMAQYVTSLSKDIPRVLDEHNAENVIFRRRYQNETNWLKRAYLYFEWRKILSYESKTCSRFDACLTVSETDRDHLRSICGDLPFAVVPNGVDTEHFSPAPIVDGSKLLYIGNMGWYPNEDAVCYFCERILPHIRQEIPEVELTIVGGDPTPRVRQLARGGRIKVTGFVEDTRQYLAQTTIAIIPLRVGSGTRLKILEALATGLPVVSTSIGCEGLDLTPEKDIVIADAPREFARRTVDLLRSRGLRLALSQNGRQKVEKKYSWRQIVADLELTYERIVSRRRQAKG